MKIENGKLLFEIHLDTRDRDFKSKLIKEVEQYAKAYAAQQNKLLLDWQESAEKVFKDLDLQEVGKELGISLGESIAIQVLPKIKELKKVSIKEEGSFDTVSKSAIKYLNDNHHPHTIMIVTPTSCEVLEGVKVIKTEEFLKD